MPNETGAKGADLADGHEPVGPPQIDLNAHQQERGAVAVKAAVADAEIAVGALHQAEQPLDLAADRGECDVHPFLPGGLAAARVPTVHQRIDDAGFGEGLAMRPAVIGLIGGRSLKHLIETITKLNEP
jgi:hypothetical protein